MEDFKVINKELASFTGSATNKPMTPLRMKPADPSLPEHPLAEKTMIVCATKIDSANPDKLKKLAAHVKRRKLEFHAISAVTGEGIDELKWSLARHLRPVEDGEWCGFFDDREYWIRWTQKRSPIRCCPFNGWKPGGSYPNGPKSGTGRKRQYNNELILRD